MIRLRFLRWGGYPALSIWNQCNHKGPYKRETEGLEVVAADVMTEARGWSDIKKGPQAKERRQFLEAAKSRKVILLQSLQKEQSPADTLILDSSPDYRRTYVCCFKPLSV